MKAQLSDRTLVERLLPSRNDNRQDRAEAWSGGAELTVAAATGLGDLTADPGGFVGQTLRLEDLTEGLQLHDVTHLRGRAVPFNEIAGLRGHAGPLPASLHPSRSGSPPGRAWCR